MCFEFEYLYWAKLEEEAKRRGEDEQRRQQQAAPVSTKAPSVDLPDEQSHPVPV